MLLTEYNEAEAMELFREEGLKEGREEGALRALTSLVQDGLLSVGGAAEYAGLREQAFLDTMRAMLA